MGCFKKMIDNVFDLSGKVVVITGSVGLLGKRHVEAVLEYGGIPVLVDLSKEKLLEQRAKITKKFNVDTMICVTDITNENQVALVGMGNKFEIWNIQNWEMRQTGGSMSTEILDVVLPESIKEMSF